MKMKIKKNKNEFKNFYLFFITFLVLGILILVIQFMSSDFLFEHEIGQSAFDQFSTGHFVNGAIACSLFLFFFTVYYKRKIDLKTIIIFSIILTFIYSVGFELLENSDFIVNSGLKYNDRADSTINSTVDVILNMLGAFLISFIYLKLFKDKKK